MTEKKNSFNLCVYFQELISVQRRLLVLRGNDLFAKSATETLLDMLKSHSGIKDCSEETILHINGVRSYFKNIMRALHNSIDYCSSVGSLFQILTELYTRVRGVRNDWRSSILSSLYGLVECTSAKILLSVARVVLVVNSFNSVSLSHPHSFNIKIIPSIPLPPTGTKC